MTAQETSRLNSIECSVHQRTVLKSCCWSPSVTGIVEVIILCCYSHSCWLMSPSIFCFQENVRYWACKVFQVYLKTEGFLIIHYSDALEKSKLCNETYNAIVVHLKFELLLIANWVKIEESWWDCFAIIELFILITIAL